MLPLFPILLLTAQAATPAIPAFPTAQGFGATATGGRAGGGGEIYLVTTLNDDGPGSLREAVSKPNRIILFNIAGLITLKSNLALSDNLTLAGQSAPGQGICLYDKSVSLSEHKNIIIRYLRFRQGIDGDRGKCSINAATAANIILDHCSIEWGRWDSLGITVNSHDITLQNCIVGEAIDPQQFGALIDSVENVTLARNLWINNRSRNPKAKGTIQYINNIVYNWGITGLCGGHSAADHSLDVIGNYFIKGPDSNNQAIGQCTTTDKVFNAGNLIDLDRDGKLNGKPAGEADFRDSGGSPAFVPAAWGGKLQFPVTVLTAEEAYKQAVAGVGCSLQRDAVDQRLIEELTSLGSKGKNIKNQSEVNAAEALKIAPAEPPKDSDHDGIPDAWEIAHGLNPSDPADARKPNADGYMMVEVYVNELADAPRK